jgi:hypothetical protein
MARTNTYDLTRYAEKVSAKDLPAMAADLSQQGLRVYVRPRGPYGAVKGNIEVLSAYVNKESAVLPTRKGTRSYRKGQTLVIAGNRSEYPGVILFPLKYPFGSGTRTLTFRVFVR